MSTPWKELFTAALVETSSERLPYRIEHAITAINQRIDELITDRERQPEHEELVEAFKRLGLLESEVRQRVQAELTCGVQRR